MKGAELQVLGDVSVLASLIFGKVLIRSKRWGNRFIGEHELYFRYGKVEQYTDEGPCSCTLSPGVP